MMYRVIVILIGGLALAACTSSSNPDWMKTPDWSKNADWFTPTAVKDTVRFESQPPGAEAKTSNGQSCRTPCALALPINIAMTVTFTLNGYQPDTEKIDVVTQIGNPTEFQPNPVVVELTPAAPVKPVKKPPAKRAPTAKQSAAPKQAATPRPATTTATAARPAPMMATPAQQQAPAPAPWPSTPPPQR
jgi:hypothetical protein